MTSNGNKTFVSKCTTKGEYEYPPKSGKKFPYDLKYVVEVPGLPKGATDEQAGKILREHYGSMAAVFRMCADQEKILSRTEVVSKFQAECRGEETVSENERGY